MKMIRCSPEAFAKCPTRALCGDILEAVFTEGSECDQFNQMVERGSAISNQSPCCSSFVYPCPHCYGYAELRRFTNWDGQVSYETAAVVCTKCGAQSKEEIISGYYGICVTPAGIIRKWNRRYGR